MRQFIVNAHVVDDQNIGDLVSSPLRYFPFPGFETQTLDLRALGQAAATSADTAASTQRVLGLPQLADGDRCHLIVGGGGLIAPRFLSGIQQLQQVELGDRAQRIVWGIGQQNYGRRPTGNQSLVNALVQASQRFDYEPYLAGFDLLGIRDHEANDPNVAWVPCASCLHPAFDRDYPIEHEFVVFSHKKFQIYVDRLPRITNESNDLESILRFLGSGETILTSSYHGAYWGLLLGRKVLAFPFSTKFVTLKHQPGYYPLKNWRDQVIRVRPFRQGFLNKISFEFRYGNKYSCRTRGWQTALKDCQSYDGILQEYRDRNQQYYQQVMERLTQA
ncbi:MAG: hypothetical protein HC838_05490 [Spirulinaceae cyanobacterium RM2_2_10]|nr:hypothetical protein [Spirulinaceae cyanobacterium SM2_1_0]NJO19618.1 hypothetical protein [Spirulinaceae cyanobacterium RM2_2_10]